MNKPWAISLGLLLLSTAGFSRSAANEARVFPSHAAVTDGALRLDLFVGTQVLPATKCYEVPLTVVVCNVGKKPVDLVPLMRPQNYFLDLFAFDGSTKQVQFIGPEYRMRMPRRRPLQPGYCLVEEFDLRWFFELSEGRSYAVGAQYFDTMSSLEIRSHQLWTQVVFTPKISSPNRPKCIIGERYKIEQWDTPALQPLPIFVLVMIHWNRFLPVAFLFDPEGEVRDLGIWELFRRP